MSQGYQIYNPNQLYFLTFQIVEWVDIFTRKEYKDIAIQSFDFCRKKKGLKLFGYVIMSNHIHLIAMAKENFSLSDIVRDFKKYTANQFLDYINNNPESEVTGC